MILTESTCLWKLDINMTQILGPIQRAETWCDIVFCHYKPVGVSLKTSTGDFQLLLQLWSLLGHRRGKTHATKTIPFYCYKSSLENGCLL